ncbi:uncharacterized protein METZ01_LOCUS209684, partial [marine metagenome]
VPFGCHQAETDGNEFPFKCSLGQSYSRSDAVTKLYKVKFPRSPVISVCIILCKRSWNISNIS